MGNTCTKAQYVIICRPARENLNLANSLQFTLIQYSIFIPLAAFRYLNGILVTDFDIPKYLF